MKWLGTSQIWPCALVLSVIIIAFSFRYHSVGQGQVLDRWTGIIRDGHSPLKTIQDNDAILNNSPSSKFDPDAFLADKSHSSISNSIPALPPRYGLQSNTPRRSNPYSNSPKEATIVPTDENNLLGATLSGVPEELRQSLKQNTGVYVTDISDGSPAFRANILKGDVIDQVGADGIGTIEDLSAILKKHVGKSVEMIVFRDTLGHADPGSSGEWKYNNHIWNHITIMVQLNRSNNP